MAVDCISIYAILPHQTNPATRTIVNKMEINRFQSSDNFRRNSIVRLWFICSMMFVFISLFSHPELSISSMFALTFEWECFYVNSQMKSVWTQLWHSIADSFCRILCVNVTNRNWCAWLQIKTQFNLNFTLSIN